MNNPFLTAFARSYTRKPPSRATIHRFYTSSAATDVEPANAPSVVGPTNTNERAPLGGSVNVARATTTKRELGVWGMWEEQDNRTLCRKERRRCGEELSQSWSSENAGKATSEPATTAVEAKTPRNATSDATPPPAVSFRPQTASLTSAQSDVDGRREQFETTKAHYVRRPLIRPGESRKQPPQQQQQCLSWNDPRGWDGDHAPTWRPRIASVRAEKFTTISTADNTPSESTKPPLKDHKLVPIHEPPKKPYQQSEIKATRAFSTSSLALVPLETVGESHIYRAFPIPKGQRLGAPKPDHYPLLPHEVEKLRQKWWDQSKSFDSYTSSGLGSSNQSVWEPQIVQEAPLPETHSLFYQDSERARGIRDKRNGLGLNNLIINKSSSPFGDLVGARDLVKSLHKVGAAKDVPYQPPLGKVDYSYVNPLPISEELREGPLRKNNMKISLRRITATVIENWETADLSKVRKVFTNNVRLYLHHRGVTVGDVVYWAWVMQARDTAAAGKRMRALKSRIKVRPFFVLFMLRGYFLDRDFFHTLLTMSKELLDPENPHHIHDDRSAVILFIRLIRQARRLWPAALETITTMITNYNFDMHDTPRHKAWVTGIYNRLISILAIPAYEGPFRNAAVHRKCQLRIIKHMAKETIPITREGYRGIISVQLAQEKAEFERNMVRKMSSSWPPYAEDDDGWDAFDIVVHGTPKSRAAQLLEQMQVAGYAPKLWELESSVLAGIDTDGTPTLLTRVFPSRYPRARLVAAQIRATRTASEAWSIFLSYRNSNPTPISTFAYEAMFEKISQLGRKHDLDRRKAEARKLVTLLDKREHLNRGFTRREIWLRHLDHAARRATPGNGSHELPLSAPHRAEPPTLPVPTPQELFKLLLTDNVAPTTKTVHRLLKEAPKRDNIFAADILHAWNPITSLHFLSPNTSAAQKCGTIDYYYSFPVFAAYLHFLLRSSNESTAINLIRYHALPHRPAWNIILAHLSRPKLWSRLSFRDRWRTCETVLTLFHESTALCDVDDEAIRILSGLCERWEIELSASQRHSWTASEDPAHEAVIDVLIKTIWERWDIPGHKPDVPPHHPEAAVLHAVVRALGFHRKFGHIETLVRWLVKIKHTLSGHMGARVLVAIRVFLEGATLQRRHDPIEWGDKERAVLDRVEKVVIKVWGGWGARPILRREDGDERRQIEGNGPDEGEVMERGSLGEEERVKKEWEEEVAVVEYLQLGGLRRGNGATGGSRESTGSGRGRGVLIAVKEKGWGGNGW